MTKAEGRTNWAAALESAEDSSTLSARIGFGFTKDDLRELVALHQAGKYQEKLKRCWWNAISSPSAAA